MDYIGYVALGKSQEDHPRNEETGRKHLVNHEIVHGIANPEMTLLAVCNSGGFP